jgi:hypothetical protein
LVGQQPAQALEQRAAAARAAAVEHAEADVRAADTFPGRGSGHFVSVHIPVTGASGNVGPALLR